MVYLVKQALSHNSKREGKSGLSVGYCIHSCGYHSSQARFGAESVNAKGFPKGFLNWCQDYKAELDEDELSNSLLLETPIIKEREFLSNSAEREDEFTLEFYNHDLRFVPYPYQTNSTVQRPVGRLVGFDETPIQSESSWPEDSEATLDERGCCDLNEDSLENSVSLAVVPYKASGEFSLRMLDTKVSRLGSGWRSGTYMHSLGSAYEGVSKEAFEGSAVSIAEWTEWLGSLSERHTVNWHARHRPLYARRNTCTCTFRCLDSEEAPPSSEGLLKWSFRPPCPPGQGYDANSAKLSGHPAIWTGLLSNPAIQTGAPAFGYSDRCIQTVSSDTDSDIRFRSGGITSIRRFVKHP